MSYEIYYNKAFIKVGENQYIPLVQHGSNNCWEFSGRREVPEKNWDVLNYTKADRCVFSAVEIQELGQVYDECEPFKSRNKRFADGEFERWFVAGIKSARTLEEFISHGNSFYINDYTDWANQKMYEIRTTEELLSKLSELKGKKLKLAFHERELRLPKATRVKRDKTEVDHYYVLSSSKGYFHSLTRYGYKYCGYKTGSLKKFKTEKLAEKYLEKYADRLKDFAVELVNEKCFI